MSAIACRVAWTEPGGNVAARTLDEAFPEGVCQAYSLSDPERTRIADDELIARVLTDPGGWKEGEILTAKLTNCFSRGLSVIRQGAADAEILSTVDALLRASDNQALIGAVVMPASEVRAVGDPIKQFCVYDTDAPEMVAHGDIVATMVRGMSNSAGRAEESARRRALRDRMTERIVLAATPNDLLVALRGAGI